MHHIFNSTAMDYKNKTWRILPLLFFGSIYAYKLSLSFEKEQELDSYVFLSIAAVGLSCYAWIIHLDVDEFLRTKEYASFAPTLAGVAMISFVTSLYSYHYTKVNSPSLIKAFYEGDHSGIEIDLKKNGHFMMSKGSGIGQTFYYGKYTIKDSLIHFEPFGKEKVIPAKELVIRTIMDVDHHDNKEGLDTAYSDYLLLKNNNEEATSETYYFRVIEDRRDDDEDDLDSVAHLTPLETTIRSSDSAR